MHSSSIIKDEKGRELANNIKQYSSSSLNKAKRFFRIKNPKKEFFCALCRAPRQLFYTRTLNLKHYLQVFLFWLTMSAFLYPVMGMNVIYLFVVILTVVEFCNKLLYRRELKCPYCGFDAAWYRRDVKKAKELVVNFWKKNEDSSLENENGSKENIEPVTLPTEPAVLSELNNEESTTLNS